jgi:hypothetical protein
MKRYLVIFLLVLLPLKLSWAAMVGYCQHETGVTANHPGHYNQNHGKNQNHEHASADHQEPAENASPSACMDHECATCHLGCSAALLSDLNTITATSSDDRPLHLQATASQPSSERPERPQWPMLA